MFLVDAHEDIAFNALTAGRDFLESVWSDRASLDGALPPQGLRMVGLPELQAGGVGLVFATLFTAPERASGPFRGYRSVQEAYGQARAQLAYYHGLPRLSPYVRLIRSRRDLEALREAWERAQRPEERPVGLILLMENADPVREPEEVHRWFAEGLRLLGPAWRGSRYAGGTAEPGPLTDLGRRLLAEMAAAGLALDTSHLAEESFFQALEAFEGPVLASHSNPRALCGGPHPDRQLSDGMIRALLEREGVIGVVPYNRMLQGGWRRGDPRLPLQRVVEHIDYICQLAGDPWHVGIGSDFDGGFGAESAPEGIETVADLPKIGEALRARGYDEAAVAAILGGNWLRWLEGVLPE